MNLTDELFGRGHFGGAIDGGKVAGDGADVQLALSLCLHQDRYLAETRLNGRFGAAIGEGLLAADVAGNFSRDGVNLIKRFRKEGEAACLCG